MTSLFIAPDGLPRCHWTGGAPEFVAYHDNEWGYPVDDDIRLFEKVCLESFQSGLSWRTILAKRDNFREAFAHFDFNKVAEFTPADVEVLLQNPGIVRHRGKIESVINNAQRAQELVKQEGSLAAFFWRYEPKPLAANQAQILTTSEQSIALSKELKKRGWKFVGPTTMFALMQAMGLINDHVAECICRDKVDIQRKKFKRPESSIAC
jgi:DNA-3-methyladenine glycosylase I